jgi:hypothetical protein
VTEQSWDDYLKTNVRICEALGLDPKTVKSISFHFSSNIPEVVVVRTAIYHTGMASAFAEEVAENYSLVRTDPEDAG